MMPHSPKKHFAAASRYFHYLAVLLFTVLLLWPASPAMAVPASPEPVEVVQPDGTKVKICLRGDEYFSWKETTTGYAVVKDESDGYWMYAKPVPGKPEFEAIPGARAGTVDPATLGLKKHDLPDRKVLREHVQKQKSAVEGTSGKQSTSNVVPTDAQSVPAAKSKEEPPLDEPPPEEPSHPVPAVGNESAIKNIVILACFSNHWDEANGTVLPAYGRTDTNEYARLFNEPGYSDDGANGSFRDYYYEVSYGKLEIDSVLTVWVKLPREEAYYHDNQRTLAADAIDAAEAAGFDFSQGDTDGDGWVDCLDIIHSGFGEEAGGGLYPDWVWSVQGGMSSVKTLDGVSMKLYHTEPAFRGKSGTGITRIGVICHETGHFFGLPDLYDYSSETKGVGHWCMMAGGIWNDSGITPAHFSAWCKVFLGFAQTVPVHSENGISLSRVEDNPVVGLMRDGMSGNEYFLLENRAKTGFDNTDSIYPGLVVYHIYGDSNNNDKDKRPHPVVKIEEADGNDSLGMPKSASSEAGDVWTSTSGLDGGFRDQTGSTNTSAMIYQNDVFYSRTNNIASYTYNRLSNFSAAGDTMTFDAATLIPAAPDQIALASTVFDVSWAACSEATTYEIQEGTNVTLTGFFDGAEDEYAMHENWYFGGGAQRVETNASYSGTSCFEMLYERSLNMMTSRKPFKVQAGTEISFRVLSHISSGNGYLKCQISNDAGDTWYTLGFYDGSINTWPLESFDYSDISALGISLNDSCLLRFVADIENTSGWSSFPAWGFALDDISITSTEIAGYGNWTTLDDNVITNTYEISAKPEGTYSYRIQAYVNDAWQGFGPVGETTLQGNQAPVWTANPVTGAEAYAGADYNSSLVSLVTDEINDTITFSKISGPTWLTVNADGTIAGTPQASADGANTFTVRATDGSGAYTDATLLIFVRSPQAHWALNESVGPTLYDSVGGFDGTAQGSLLYSQTGVPGAAAGNSAVYFSGSSTGVSFPALNVASNTMTITAMIKCNGIQDYYPGIVSWSSGSTNIVLGFGDSNNRLTFMRNSSVYSSSTLVVPEDQWVFTAVSISPSSTVLYMATNSTLSSYATSRTDPADTVFTSAGSIGNSPFGRFDGTIDDVSIYNTALSATQIGQLAASAFTAVPYVDIISPAGETTLVEPASFHLEASITDNGHTVSTVQFYQGASLLAEMTSPPYSTTVSNLALGTYTFSAKAVYDGGNVVGSTSTVVNVVQPETAALQSSPLGSNLVAYLPFDSDYSDYSGQGNDPALSNSNVRAAGFLGANAYVLTNSGYLSFGMDEDFHFPHTTEGDATSFSISFWAKNPSGSYTGEPVFISNQDWADDGNTGWALASGSSSDYFQMNFKESNANLRHYDSASAPGSDWHHYLVVFTRDATRTCITYIDGAEVDSRTMFATGVNIDDAGLPVNIGQDGTGTGTRGTWNGALMDDVAFWRRTVTATEAAAIYAAGTNGIAMAYAQAAPVITNFTADLTLPYNASTNLSVGVLSGSTPTYQWRIGGSVINDATNRTLAVTNNASPATNSYDVIVSNSNGSTTSQVVVVTMHGAPSVGNVTVYRETNAVLKVTDTMLLANSSDPENSALSVVWVSEASTHGGTVELSGQWITYIPPTGYNVADAFSFRVRNAFGNEADGTVTVLMDTSGHEGSDLNIESATVTGSNVLIRIAGIPGRTFDVQHATVLTPVPDWGTIGSTTIGSLGYSVFTNAPPPEGSVHFYRTIEQE